MTRTVSPSPELGGWVCPECGHVWSPPCADGPEAADALESAQAEIARLTTALSEMRAFVGVMYGQGADAVIPETATGPLGFPIKIGAICRDADAALAKIGGGA
jgi:hypothetical protein